MGFKKIYYNLKAYHIIAMGQCMRRISYKSSFLLGFIGKILSIFLYCFLWSSVYNNASEQQINGFTKNEMILYVVIAFVVSDLISCEVAKNIGDDVREGSIAMMLIKPISYQGSLVAKGFGDYLYKIIFPGIFVFIGAEIFKVQIMQTDSMHIIYFLLLFVSLLCSFLIFAFFDFCFGMFSIKTTYSFGMLVIKDAVLMFVSGQMIPYSFMPEVLNEVLQILPFSSMIYTPVMIFLGKYEIGEIIMYIFAQLFWVFVLYFAGKMMWKKSVKQISILGG